MRLGRITKSVLPPKFRSKICTLPVLSYRISVTGEPVEAYWAIRLSVQSSGMASPRRPQGLSPAAPSLRRSNAGTRSRQSQSLKLTILYHASIGLSSKIFSQIAHHRIRHQPQRLANDIVKQGKAGIFRCNAVRIPDSGLFCQTERAVNVEVVGDDADRRILI